MSCKSTRCGKCGQPVVFRVVNGRRVPFHFHRTCTAQDNQRRPKANIIDSWNDSFCRLTKCPKCRADVFFVRYNGGSVWFDELGWPWKAKHPCFPDQVTPKTEKTSWSETVPQDVSLTGGLGLIIRARRYSDPTLSKQLLAISSSDSGICVSVPPNAGLVAGQLVVVRGEDPIELTDLDGNEIESAKIAPETFGLSKEFLRTGKINAAFQSLANLPKQEMIKCRVCGKTVERNQFRKHMWEVHGRKVSRF